MVKCQGKVISYDLTTKIGYLQVFDMNGVVSIEEAVPIGVCQFTENVLSENYKRIKPLSGDRVLLNLRFHSECHGVRSSQNFYGPIDLICRVELIETANST